MSKARHVSETPATQFLKQNKVAYTEHTYEYIDHGGAGEAARQLGLDPHAVVKTLVMEDESAKPLIVVMHGDREVSTKNLARQAGLKKVEPCKPEVAQRHSGYQVGGTSPFGTRKKMPVWVEAEVLHVVVRAGQARPPREILPLHAPGAAAGPEAEDLPGIDPLAPGPTIAEVR